MALSAEQKRKARRKLAQKRGVSEGSITDSMIYSALSSSEITQADCGGSSYDSGYDGGSSSSCE